MTDERLAFRFPPCDYMYSRGSKRGTLCDAMGNYDGKCCKHKAKPPPEGGGENTIQRLKKMSLDDKKAANTEKLKDDPIFNDKVEEPKSKTKSSIWNFTINTNTNYDTMSADDKKRFKKWMANVFDEDSIFDYVTDQESYDDPKKNVDEIKTDYYFENSGKNLLHAHGIIRILHHGYLRIRYNDIRDYAKIIFGKNLHIDMQASSDHVNAWENYMSKSGVAGKITF